MVLEILIGQLTGFLTGLELMFVLVLSLLGFLFFRIFFRQINEEYSPYISALVAVGIFYWLHTYFLGFIVTSLALTGIMLLLFYIFGIPSALLLAILLAVIDRRK
jgi:hypothetical protein